MGKDRKAAFTHTSEQANARWAREAREAGNEALAREHERYATGRVVEDGDSYRVEQSR